MESCGNTEIQHFPGFVLEKAELFSYRQIGLFTEEKEISFRISKKGKIARSVNTKNQTKAISSSHNREKNYLIREGDSVPFMVDLGVFTKEGKVVAAKYDKFRQINRFLEFIEDILDKLPMDRTIRIIDFGCGKSYLTFAIYYATNTTDNSPNRGSRSPALYATDGGST